MVLVCLLYSWNYQSAEKLQYGTFQGRLAKYSGGGFTRLLADKAAESRERVADLKVSYSSIPVLLNLSII